jgi:hypothetical protein
MRRSRATRLITTLLALATAIALFAAGWVIAEPAVADPVSAATETTVRAFYVAVNQTIRTGDPSLLESVVAEDVVVQGSLATLAPDRAKLTEYLVGLHATTPQLVLDVREMAASDNRAVVEVTTNGSAEGVFLGSPLHGPAAWGAVDSLRIDHHQISEFWTDTERVAMVESLAHAPVLVGADPVQVVTLLRLTLPSRESLIVAGSTERRWMYLETGEVTVTPQDDHTSTGVNPTALGATALFALPVDSQIEVHNAGGAQASVLILRLALPLVTPARSDATNPKASPASEMDSNVPTWTGQSPITIGSASVTTLASSVQTTLPTGRAVITVSKATLAPWTQIADLETLGPLVIVVTGGTLELVASGHLAMIHRGTDHYGDKGTLAADESALLTLDTVASLRNLGQVPVAFTVIAILPASAVVEDAA